MARNGIATPHKYRGNTSCGLRSYRRGQHELGFPIVRRTWPAKSPFFQQNVACGKTYDASVTARLEVARQEACIRGGEYQEIQKRDPGGQKSNQLSNAKINVRITARGLYQIEETNSGTVDYSFVRPWIWVE